MNTCAKPDCGKQIFEPDGTLVTDRMPQNLNDLRGGSYAIKVPAAKWYHDACWGRVATSVEATGESRAVRGAGLRVVLMTKTRRMKMGHSYCLVQSIQGPLMNWTDAEWNDACKWTTQGDGSPFKDGRALKAEYLRMYGLGWHVLRTGPCDNHHKKHGCMGHKIDA